MRTHLSHEFMSVILLAGALPFWEAKGSEVSIFDLSEKSESYGTCESEPLAPIRPLPEVGNVSFQTIFESNSSFTYNHMAMIEYIPSRKRLIAAWQAAKHSEGSNSQVLLVSHSDDEGFTWSSPSQVHREANAPEGVLWSPVLQYLNHTGELLLFFSESTACLRPPKEGKAGEPRWSPGGDIKVVASNDAGEVWGEPRTVYPQEAEGGIPKVIANRALPLTGEKGPAGRLVLPFWRERARGARPAPRCPSALGPEGDRAAGSSGVLISDDGGKSWAPHGLVADPAGATWLIEGSVAETASGDLIMLLRSAADTVWASRSEDGGLTWSTPEPTSLPNPNSKVSVIKLLGRWGGTLMAALNHHPRLRGPHSRTRSRLSLAASGDGGRSWVVVARLEEAMAPGNWYHYPTLMELPDGRVLVAYSVQHSADGRDGIRLATVSLRPSSRGSPVQHFCSRDMPRNGTLVPLSGSSFSASSSHADCSPSHAVLHGERAWCAAAADSSQWLQVDLGRVRNVTHLILAGRPDSRGDQRVTALTVSSTTDGWQWEPYRGASAGEEAVEEVVLGGVEARGALRVLPLRSTSAEPGLLASAIRLHPLRWVGHVSMQVGVVEQAATGVREREPELKPRRDEL